MTLPTDDTPLTEAAVLYAELGLRVLPVWGVRQGGGCACGKPACTTPGKHPIERAWQKKASSDPNAVRDARRAHPEANVGLAMGGAERIVAVDIDGATGRASWEAIEAEHGPAPVTLTSVSGRADGGEHRLFRVPLHLDIKQLGNRSSFRHAGIDTRIDNGQIVVAPSRHASGARYRWVVEAPIATMPDWLFAALASPQEATRRAPPAAPPSAPSAPAPTAASPAAGVANYLSTALRNACDRIRTQASGGRNALLFAKATTQFEYCIGENVPHLVAWNSLYEAGVACGLPAQEVGSVLAKAWRQAQANPRRVPPAQQSAPTTYHQPNDASWAAPDGTTTAPDGTTTPAAEDYGWQQTMRMTGEGKVKNSFGNVCKILRHHPQWKGRLTYNMMRVVPCLDGKPLKDSDISRIREAIEGTYEIAPERSTVMQAVSLIAEEHSFHPVQDYLRGLAWDGTSRIGRVSAEVLGTHVTDLDRCDERNLLNNRMLECFFVSAVARALDPGCKVDSAVVLHGGTGFRKSTFFRILGGEWFGDSYADIRNKDGVLQVHAAWIYEWAEIDRITTRTNSSDVKAFITVARDDVRPPYGAGVVNMPRSGVIVGTTNRPFLDDETGNRRFHPLSINKKIDEKRLTEWRDQLWAEAVHLYRNGTTWWLTENEERLHEELSDEHTVENPWVDKIAMYLNRPDLMASGVTIAEVLTKCMGIDLGKVQRGDETRAGKALRSLGWAVSRERKGAGARVRLYKPIGKTRIAEEPGPTLGQPSYEVGPQVGPPFGKQSQGPTLVGQPVQPDQGENEKGNAEKQIPMVAETLLAQRAGWPTPTNQLESQAKRWANLGPTSSPGPTSGALDGPPAPPLSDFAAFLEEQGINPRPPGPTTTPQQQTPNGEPHDDR
jgi:hypothetical protein